MQGYARPARSVDGSRARAHNRSVARSSYSKAAFDFDFEDAAPVRQDLARL